MDTLSCCWEILFCQKLCNLWCLVPILPKTDNLLPFVFTVRSHNTCDRLINSPLPKRHKHIIYNTFTPSSQLRTNFASTSPQLRTNFASTLYELCPDFIRTTPQLHMNFARSSHERIFSWKHNIYIPTIPISESSVDWTDLWCGCSPFQSRLRQWVLAQPPATAASLPGNSHLFHTVICFWKCIQCVYNTNIVHIVNL